MKQEQIIKFIDKYKLVTPICKITGITPYSYTSRVRQGVPFSAKEVEVLLKAIETLGMSYINAVVPTDIDKSADVLNKLFKKNRNVKYFCVKSKTSYYQYIALFQNRYKAASYIPFMKSLISESCFYGVKLVSFVEKMRGNDRKIFDFTVSDGTHITVCVGGEIEVNGYTKKVNRSIRFANKLDLIYFKNGN